VTCGPLARRLRLFEARGHMINESSKFINKQKRGTTTELIEKGKN
jgi:hypothetical protein